MSERRRFITTLETMSGLIGDIYDTTLDPDLWPSVLERSCLFVGAASASIMWQEAVERAATIFYAHGDDPSYLSSYMQKYIHLDPMFPAAAFVEPGLVFAGSDLVPHDELRETQFYQEWVAPQGLIDFVGINIQRHPTSCASFSLRLGNEHGVADPETRRRTELITPHIRRAVLIGRQIRSADSRIGDYEAVLDAHAAAVFLVGDGGQLRFANQAGRAMLQEGTVMVERNGSVAACNAQASRRLREAAAGLLATEQDRNTISIALTDSAPRWLADVLPLRSGSRLALGREQKATAAIFVRRAEIPAVSGIEIMAQLYKLRASETRVLHAIAKGGGSVDELAVALGIASGTVKSHINALFAKTGTSRRDELIREVAAHGGVLA